LPDCQTALWPVPRPLFALKHKDPAPFRVRGRAAPARLTSHHVPPAPVPCPPGMDRRISTWRLQIAKVQGLPGGYGLSQSATRTCESFFSAAGFHVHSVLSNRPP
jgi:hypothetical protein